MGEVSGAVVEVAHMVPSPAIRLDATQPAGKAGVVTPSKFSLNTVAPQVGVGVTVPPAVAVGVGDAVTLGLGEAVTLGLGEAVTLGLGLAVPLAVGVGQTPEPKISIVLRGVPPLS